MHLQIDNREPKDIIALITSLIGDKIPIEIKSLDLGDYVLYDEKTEKPIFVIERKSLADLESSIKDGRYNEQSIRLSSLPIHNHNIYYLIEGSIVNYKNASFKDTLYATLFSISYYKGFSLVASLNAIETANIIVTFVDKYLREIVKGKKQSYYQGSGSGTGTGAGSGTGAGAGAGAEAHHYESAIKPVKKLNITKDNINIIMLMQIPGVSHTIATIIMEKYHTIKNLMKEIDADPDCLSSLKNEKTDRKISKTALNAIKTYLV